jgi:hypothetical protein
VNAELEAAIDEVASTGCGACGRSLPRPGVRCGCGAFPDITREEAARELRVPGELSLRRADQAEQDALDLMFQFTAAAKVPDRHRKLAELETEAAEVNEALAEAAAGREKAAQALAAAQEAEAGALKPLEKCRALGKKAMADLEAVVRTCQADDDPEAEWNARIRIAQLHPVFDARQRAYNEAAAVTASRRLDLEHADLQIAACEQARDEEATARLYLDEVRPGAETLILLARPLTEYLAELLADQGAGQQYPGEWANMLGLLHRMAGAAGLLALAEEGAAPRILQDLTGPMSRAQDVAAFHRRVGDAFPRLELPAGPGEATVTYHGTQAPHLGPAPQ